MILCSTAYLDREQDVGNGAFQFTNLTCLLQLLNLQQNTLTYTHLFSQAHGMQMAKGWPKVSLLASGN